MGQYHAVYNISKKEFISPLAMGNGAKLLEWTGPGILTGLSVLLANSNGRGGGDLYSRDDEEADRAIKNVSGRWAGDKIVVQGDYAEAGDPAFISDEELEDFTNISSAVRAALEADEYLKTEMGR